MPESSINVEIAHKLHENNEKRAVATQAKERHEARLEILEAFLLAIVAVCTAWSGYQSARWDGHSAASYAQATALRVDGDNYATLGGQERLQDIMTFDTWLQARTSGNDKAAQLLERRFSEDYEPVFRAWLATDPFNNPNAPPGPKYMPGYKNHLIDEGAEMRLRADEAFETGRADRELGEDYVRLTVFLATVLFLIAISQRFRNRWAKFGLLGVAVVATGITLSLLISYPIA